MTDESTPVTPPVDFDPVPSLATALDLDRRGVAAVVALLAEGNTVPFIARYRKERTGGLDEVQIRAIEEKREYILDLESRRAAILASVKEQGKLTPELEAKLRAADTKSVLEDLYAPYRPRRKTRASVAREKGLQGLADKIAAQGAEGNPEEDAVAFVAGEVATVEDALAGARDIVAEQIADTAEVRAFARAEYAEHGHLISEVVPGKADEPTKFEQYYAHDEPVKSIPSHRFLAIRRGEAEGVLRARVSVDFNTVGVGIERIIKLDAQSPWAHQLHLAIADALKRLLAPSVENDVRAEIKQRSDVQAVDVFANNLRNLLLASPLGSASVIGVDPGLRTGCKCAAIDATGKFLGTVTVYITQGDAQLAAAKEDFLAFVQKFSPRAIAVGNGTGGREAEAFVKKCLGDAGLREGANAPFVVQVNEAGASVYSASDLAREEFPELDLTIRGAISIARRLQDPLAELVKIEPKAIGVGQYQHDVHQPLLSKKLGDVVEDCVNRVGVDLNTSSAQLLGYVAGIGKALAKKLVIHRDTNGSFTSRQQLLDVGGLGPKAFEQAAGFLKIVGGAQPLDASGVHPERYPLVEKIAADNGVELSALIGNAELVDKIDFSTYVSDDVGEPTLRDIASELKKPGRDPRAEFNPPRFRDDVTSMEDLKPGMVLEGIVTNVTAFGAFVDIGVHNDGLVHVSQLSDQFIKDPAEVVKVGQKLTVRVLEVDNARKRIGLSAKRGGQQAPKQPRGDRQQQHQGGQQHQGQQNQGGQQGQGGDNQGGSRRGKRGGRGRGGGQQYAQGEGQPHGDNAQLAGGQLLDGQQFADGPQRDGQQGDQQNPGHQGDGQQQGDGQGGRRQWRGRGGQLTGGHQGGQQAGGQHSDQQGGDQQGGGQHGDDQQGSGQHAGDQQGQRGGGQRGGGGGQRGGVQRGGQRGGQWQGGGQQGGGPQGRGPQGGGQGGGGQGGGGQRNDRGPRGGGPNDRGPNDRGPGGQRPFNDRGPGGQGGQFNDRGPRGGGGPNGPNDRQFNDRGPRGPGGPNDRGPRRDDRGPRQDRPSGPPPENWGVSGFTNNPFAKLTGKNDKS